MQAKPLAELLPTVDTLVANIVWTYNESSEQDRSEGIEWYAYAHLFADRIAPSVKVGAGVLAALSPQVSWSMNQRLARNACQYRKFTGQTGANVRKARAIINGHNPTDVFDSDRLERGCKVRAFYACILDPNNAHHVVIDRHAFDIALGCFDHGIDGHVLDRIGGYEYFADAYRKAGAELGLLPLQVQAITWLAWRRRKRTKSSTFTDF